MRRTRQPRGRTGGGYRAFPTDAEFADALKTTDLYHFKRRSYFLRRLENHHRKEHVTIEDYTIEHILPQNENLSQAWRDALGENWADIQAQYLQTLGNLTLTGYDSEYSDHPFPVKRDMEGGFKDSPLRLNQGLGQLDTWNAGTIRSRADRLATTSLEIGQQPHLPARVMKMNKLVQMLARRATWEQLRHNVVTRVRCRERYRVGLPEEQHDGVGSMVELPGVGSPSLGTQRRARRGWSPAAASSCCNCFRRRASAVGTQSGSEGGWLPPVRAAVDVPPQSSGARSAIACVKVQLWPARSSAEYWRSP